jgi:hypothetical protein
MSDIAIVDYVDPDAVSRRRSTSIVASIPGRYALTRQIGAEGNRREFSCRVVKISPDEMTLVARVNGAIGERVIATLLEFGKLEGPVLKTHDTGFVMRVAMTDAEREKFAAKIEWYDKHKNRGVPDSRKAKRIIPQHPHCIVMLSDGAIVGAFVIDMSVTGVAISADIEPEIGEPLAVGKIVGRVVRRFAGGFGVKFIDPRNAQTLERMLLAPTCS